MKVEGEERRGNFFSLKSESGREKERGDPLK